MSIAFYAPMKPLDHPTPSGDRRIGRLLFEALERGGFDPFIASDLRIYDAKGARAAQQALFERAEIEAKRLVEALGAHKPRLWFTYHCYYKAPDLVGPIVSAALGIPYVIAEASLSPKRLQGPWAAFAEASARAIYQADLILTMTPRDAPALRDAPGRAGRVIADLAPFINPGPAPPPRKPAAPVRLLTVAMMRPGDKLDSYQALSEALALLKRQDWRLDIIGDGAERGRVEALFKPFSNVHFHGRLDEEVALRASFEQADIFLWPGIGEAFGMAYLEAQAAGAPVLAYDLPGPRGVIKGEMSAPDPQSYASALEALLADPAERRRRGEEARAYILRRHSIDAASKVLRAHIEALI